MRDAGEQRQEGLQEPADVLQHPLPASTHHRSGCPGKRDAVQNRVRRNHPGERCGSAYAPAGDEIWGVHSARSTFRPPQHFTRPRKRAGGAGKQLYCPVRHQYHRVRRHASNRSCGADREPPGRYRKPRDDLRQRHHRHRRDDRTAQVRETGQEDAPRSHGPGPARIHP